MPDSPRLIPLIRRLASSAIVALATLVLTVAVMAFLTRQSARWVTHTRQVQLACSRALELALDRQSSIAGYLITDDTAMLALERRARPALQSELDSLAALTADNPWQQSQLLLIGEAVRRWNRTYADPILQSPDAAARARISREQQAGVPAFAAVRSGMNAFLGAESALYTTRARRNTLWRSGEVAVVALEAVLVLIVLVRLRRELLARATQSAEQQAQLEEQAAELEAQATEQEMLTADLELANQELTEVTVEAEEARDAAMALEERYRLLFDRSPVPMWVFDDETLRFLHVNEAAVRQYGFSMAEFLRMTLEDIRPPEDVPRLRKRECHSLSLIHI